MRDGAFSGEILKEGTTACYSRCDRGAGGVDKRVKGKG